MLTIPPTAHYTRSKNKWVIFSGSVLNNLEKWVLNIPIYHNESNTNYDEVLVFYLFWRCAMKQSKIVNIIYWKNRNHYTVILWKSWKSLGLISSLHDRTKNDLELFVMSCTNSDHSLFWCYLGFLRNSSNCNF